MPDSLRRDRALAALMILHIGIAPLARVTHIERRTLRKLLYRGTGACVQFDVVVRLYTCLLQAATLRRAILPRGDRTWLKSWFRENLKLNLRQLRPKSREVNNAHWQRVLAARADFLRYCQERINAL